MEGSNKFCYAVGCTVWHRKGGGRLFRFPRNPVRYVHKIIEQKYDHLLIWHTTHFRCQTEFINFHTLTRVFTECSIMHYNKSISFFCIVQFSNMTRTQFLTVHALNTLNVHYCGLHMHYWLYMVCGVYQLEAQIYSRHSAKPLATDNRR
jgi:hypothetical protein